MKESKSEKSSSEEKNESSILNSAKKVLKNLDPNIENLDDSKNHSNDSLADSNSNSNSSSESKNESKKSPIQNLPVTEEIENLKSKNQSNSTDSKEIKSSEDYKSTFSRIKTEFNQFKNSIQEDRQKLFSMIGLLVAVVLILLGISFLLGTSDKVSDNVVFGEKSVTSAFFIILGLLIIAGIYAPKIIGKTSFNNIYEEMKGVEEKSSKKDENNSKSDDLKTNTSPKEIPSKESKDENLNEDENFSEKEELLDIPDKEK